MNAKLSGHPLAPIKKDRLKADFREAGVTPGDHLLVALSFKSMGFVEGGPNTFIDALLEVVGSEGTILMNTHTKHFPISVINPEYVFDPKSTLPLTGLVPTILIKRGDAIRSRHPTCSVAAIGRLAEYLTRDHDESSRPYLPIEKLTEVGGKVLFIGINGRLVALRHEAQRRAGLFMVPLFTGVQFKKGVGDKGLFVWTLPPCTSKLPEFVPKLESMGVVERCMIGGAASFVGGVDELLDSMSAMLKEDPTLMLCDDPACVCCRELERRMNLYRRIVAPKLFQKNLLFRWMLSFRAKLILRHYSFISVRRAIPSRLSRLDAVLEDIVTGAISFSVRTLSETASSRSKKEVAIRLDTLRVFMSRLLRKTPGFVSSVFSNIFW